MFLLLSLLLIIFCFIVVIFKIITQGRNKKAEAYKFQEFNDPGNFVNPFNEYNN